MFCKKNEIGTDTAVRLPIILYRITSVSNEHKGSFYVPYVETFQHSELFQTLAQALAPVGLRSSAPPSVLDHSSASGWPEFYETSHGSEDQDGRLPAA